MVEAQKKDEWLEAERREQASGVSQMGVTRDAFRPALNSQALIDPSSETLNTPTTYLEAINQVCNNFELNLLFANLNL